MWSSKAHLMLFLGVQLLLASSSISAFGLGSLTTELISGFQTNVRSALGAVKNTSDVARNVGGHVLHPIETVKNSSVGEIAQDVGGQVLRPIESSIDAAKNTTAGEIAMDIGDHVLHPIETVKNLSEVVLTTNVFTRNNQTLNCLGIPIKFFANAIEKIFTQTTSAKDVRFYFASRRQPDYVTVRVGKEFTLRGTDFNISRPTVVISHGFLSSGQDSWLKRMKDALLKLDDLNVIVVDWQEGSNTWNYYSASISTRIVGQQIATLFAQIREQALAKSSSSDVNNWGALYFIGHSLGSHIVAHAAFMIKESQREAANSWIVSRITGLDPAQPCFRTANLTLKLDKDDATYVDVIHTNARHILFLGLGLPDQLGFVDFYPNGGDLQPGCLDIDTSIWSFILLPQKLLQEIICSHGRSHAFLIESIENAVTDNCSFIGYQWDRTIKREPRRLKDICNAGLCTEMGINSASYYPDNPGIYYVPTAESAPFCGDGNVSFEEFVEIASNIGGSASSSSPTDQDQEEQELRDAFRVFDKRNRGYITASDLRAVLQCLGEDLSEEEIEDMIKEVDVDGDGRIDFYEFVRALGEPGIGDDDDDEDDEEQEEGAVGGVESPASP